MDSWEFTKIAAAVLSALLIMMGAKTAIEIAQASHGHEIVGFKLPVKETAVAAAEKPADAGVPYAKVVEMMPKASSEAGQAVFKQCQQCHTPAKGGANGTGPNLWAIIDRPRASVAGFAYSEAAKSKPGEKWTYENLVRFISDPKGYMPGTKMAYKGIQDTAQLVDLLSYLRTLADTPVDMPK